MGFSCKILKNVGNIIQRNLRFFYTFVLREEKTYRYVAKFAKTFLSGFVLPTITALVQQLKAMTFEVVLSHVHGNRRPATPPAGQNFRDTLVQSLTDRFFLDQLDVTGEETDTCEIVPFYLLASFTDPRFRDLSFLSETERSALVEFASKTVKAMPSLPASCDVASTT